MEISQARPAKDDRSKLPAGARVAWPSDEARGVRALRGSGVSSGVPPISSSSTTASNRHEGLPLLLGGSNQNLIDRHMPRACDDVGDCVGDVCRLHARSELVTDGFEYLRPVVTCQFRGGCPRFN